MLRHDYSLPERAVVLWSAVMLGVLAVMSLGLRYVTNPISCWTPPEFTGAYVQYANDVCFQHTHIWNPTVPGPLDGAKVQKPRFTYHQWVPFALGMATILCLVPHLVWRMLSGFLWLDVHGLVQTLADNQRHNSATRHVVVKDAAHMVQAGLRGGNWILTAAVLGRKALVCVVCVVQMIVLVVLFKPRFSPGEMEKPGPSVTHNPLPEEFICDLPIRALQNIQRWSLPCKFTLSQVYSQGFTFLFYFFLLLAMCCFLDLLLTVARVAIPVLRDSRLKRYLAVSQVDLDPQVQGFLDSLGVDGRLVVAVTSEVCGPVAAADLTSHLWMTFKASCAGAGMVLGGASSGAVSG